MQLKIQEQYIYFQCSKKVLSGCPGQVDVNSVQVPVAFHPQVPKGHGIRQVTCHLYQLWLAQSKQKMRATCPKGRLEFKFFQALYSSINMEHHVHVHEASSRSHQSHGINNTCMQSLCLCDLLHSSLHSSVDCSQPKWLLLTTWTVCIWHGV